MLHQLQRRLTQMLFERKVTLLRSLMLRFRNSRWLAVMGGILLLGFLFSQLSPVFLQLRNLQNIVVQSAVTGVMAIGMTFVLMTAGIDISVGGILYLTIVLITEMSLKGLGAFMPYLIYLVALAIGAFLGLINGLLTNYMRINPLITTLATLSVYRGLALHINQGRHTVAPASLRFLGIGKIAGIPVPFIMAILVMLIGSFILHYTRFGRCGLAIGNSKHSAYDSGLPVRRVLITVYVIAGFCSGLAGLIMLGRVGTVQPNMGIGVEFTVITAVVMGGTLLSGGRASILGSLMGAVLLVMIDNGLNLIQASAFIYDIVKGSVLVGAVLVDRATTLGLFKKWFSFSNS